MPQGYARSQVPALVGLTRRQVIYLAERGLVSPSVRGPSGRGSPTIYAYEDLRRLAVIAALTRLTRGEVVLEQARAALSALERLSDGPWGGQVLLLDGELAWVVEAGEVATMLEHQPELIVIDLGRTESALGVQLRRNNLMAA